MSESHGQPKSSPEGEASPPPLVTVMAVTEKDVNPPEEFVGRIEAIQAVDLRAQVSGYLEKVSFKEGELVTEGKLLYQIERAPYVAKVNADQASVAQSQATLTLAQQYLKRLHNVDSGGVSASDIETAESETVRAQASLQKAQATLEQSKINLGYATIKAPVPGRIGKNKFTRGNLVGTDSGTLARIVQIDPIRVVFSVSENKLSEIQEKYFPMSGDSLHKSQVIRIQLPNGTIYSNSGRPDFMDNEVDPDTGTIAIRARLDNPNGLLLPGEYVTVLISKAHSRDMPVVPQAAVLEDRDGRYVFVVDSENKAHHRQIETGDMLDTEWAVKSGLTKGERIVVQGIQKVRPGQEVSPMPNSPDQEGAGK